MKRAAWTPIRRARMKGASTLEFALILPLFLLIVYMIFELGIAFVTQELLDNAARDAARLMRIGTLTGNSYATSLTTAVCNDLTFKQFNLVPSCAKNIQIYVAAANSGAPVGHGFTTLKTASISGQTMTQTRAALSANYDVVLQVGYAYQWTLPMMSLMTGSTLLVSTLAFQTEPY